MSRKRLPVWRILLVMGADLLAIGLGSCIAYWIRFYSPLVRYVPVKNGFEPLHYLHILPCISAIWFLALRFENLYRRRSRVFDFNVVKRIFTGSTLAMLVLIACVFYLKLPDSYSRLASVILMPIVIASLILNRIALHFVFQWMMLHHGVGQTRTAILGGGPLAEQIYQSLLRHPEHGMLPVGMILSHSVAETMWPAKNIPVLGRIDNLEALLLEHRINEVILSQPELDHDQLPELLVACERALAAFRIVPDVTEMLLSGMTVETIDGLPLLGIRETPLQGWNAALKRMLDFLAALSGLILTAPLVGLLAWVIKRQDGASPFFTQERMGVDGRLFKIIKLRTMRPNAEVESGPIFASDYDPRCTPLGTLLRKTHIDELPQLLNVLKGEMSLVGPRPERPYFIEQFRNNVPRYMVRHKVRSGMTGWAQVNGFCGRHGTIPERLKYDLYYIENWSLWLDIKILALTVFGRIRPGPV